jgi:DNA-binding GntR family transcriptional regulator
MPKGAGPLTGEDARRRAREQLRRAILRGEMVPAQRLTEPDLAERFGVTRAGVRAALVDLTAEGLVERVRHRGARVRVVTVEETVAITECRMVLEGLCAAKAAVVAGDEQLRELADLGTAMTEAVSGGELVACSELALRLHARIQELSGQQAAAELLQRLNTQLVCHRLQLLGRPGHLHQSLEEHRAVIEAITARNPRAAEEAVRTHLTCVISVL